MINRRHFFKVTAVSVAGLSRNGFGLDVEAKKEKGSKLSNDYSIVMVGDTHYDKKPDEVYHSGYSDPNPTREANHRKEFVRNADMWSDRTRRLLRRASKLVTPDTRMAFQLGDLIQGDTGSAEAHKLMLDDAFCYVKGAIGGVPLITCAGNHDLRAKDDKVATKAYTEYMTERMSGELGKDIEKICFSFTIGPDAFIVVDFTYPDDEEIDKLFKETEGARYTFVVIHGPVFPYQSKTCNWIMHGKDKNDVARRHFRKLLAERNAIVICGHTHTTEMLDWFGDGGRITQMTVNSVWADEKKGKDYKPVFDKAEDYGKVVIDGGDKEQIALMEEYKPGIKRFIMARTCGSYKLHVSDKSVTVDYYAGESLERSEEFILR